MGRVSAPSLTRATTNGLPSPQAARARKPGWRDPRLLGGLVLICLSVLGGVKVLAGADDTVAVLAARTPLAAGQRIDQADLQSVRLRFASTSDADRYLPGDANLDGAVLVRPVGAGELVPRAAVANGGHALTELPLAVDPARVPSGVTAGSIVDVFVGASDGHSRGTLLVARVPVLSTTRPSVTSAAGTRQIVVGVDPKHEAKLASVVAGLGQDAALLLVRRP
jgi:Flp pilus assembly protein CpaB